jgi:hypothetical protein
MRPVWPILVLVEGIAISTVRSTDHADRRFVIDPPPARALLGKLGPLGLLSRDNRKPPGGGTLHVTATALILNEPAVFSQRIVIPLELIRKAIVDDGTLWGHASESHRFPVYDIRSDGFGSGALVGSLWGPVSSLMPPGCRMASVDPVPAEAPNLALIFEPSVAIPKPRTQNGDPHEADWVAGLLLRVKDPAGARAALAHSVTVAYIDHDDLECLGGGARSVQVANGDRPAVSAPS